MLQFSLLAESPVVTCCREVDHGIATQRSRTGIGMRCQVPGVHDP